MRSKTGCLICNNPQLDNLYVAKGYEIVACNRCGFCQVAQQPSDDELESLYANLHVIHTKFRDEQAAHRENCTRLHLMRRYAVTGQLILDAGCATGDFIALAKDHYTVYGVDISAGAIEHAKLRMPDIAARLSSFKIEDLSDQWPKFDVICLWDVIEHVRDPVHVCRTLMSMLKPGGHLILSTPDIGALTAKVMKQNWAFMIPPLHLGYFSRRSFDYLFSRQVPGSILDFRTQGKWTSLAFLFYKINQISRWLAPPRLLEPIKIWAHQHLYTNQRHYLSRCKEVQLIN